MFIGCHCRCQYLILLLAWHQHCHPSCFCNPVGYRSEYRAVHSPYTGRMGACMISCICRRGTPELRSELVLLSSSLFEVLHRHPMTNLCSPAGLVLLDLPAVRDARWQPDSSPSQHVDRDSPGRGGGSCSDSTCPSFTLNSS